MRGMEVYLNGASLCTAGIGKDAVLNAIVDVLSRNGDYHMMLRVGGLENDEFMTWCKRDLQLGDEVTIRIVEADSIDPPEQRKAVEPAS